MNFHITTLTTLLVMKMIAGATISQPDDFEFLILHNNDMHSRFEQTRESIGGKPVGGFARTSHEIKHAREAANNGTGPPVLYLNAGDTYQGTVWFTKHKWKISADFMNALMPDAMSLGNHEFDDGVEGLVPFLQKIKFPMLACNLKLNKETVLANLVQRSVVLNLHGRKIGVIGYLTPETKLMSSVGTLDIMDEVEAVRAEAERLTKDGINIIIALGHSGHLVDKKIAKLVKDVDIVIGGHTNTFLWNGVAPDKEIPEDAYPTEVTQKSGKVVPVVQAFAYTKYLGKLMVSFDKDGILKTFKGQPILMDASIPEDQDVLDLLEIYRPAIANLNITVVGQSKVYLEGFCRVSECNFGNLIMDSMVNYRATQYKGPYWTDAPIAIMNAGAVRQSINTTLRGYNLTEADILGALPFDSILYIIELKGEDLLRTLEIGARSNGETSRGEFLIYSGLRVVFDYSLPPGSRVVSAKARCGNCDVPSYDVIDKNKYYSIITAHFLIKGGDGHTVIRDKPRQFRKLDINEADALKLYFERSGVLTPELDERTIINNFSLISGAFKLSFCYVSMLVVFLTRIL